MNFSVEAEGIDFILRFRDEASDQINVAEKSYQRLVSAMQSLIQTQRAFSDSTTETLNLASQALKNNPFPIATPLTLSPDQISLMAQFEGRATSWFQKMSSQMLGYINRVRRATIETNNLREAISGIVGDIKIFVKGLGGAVPLLQQFAQIKLPEMSSRSLRNLVKDLQSIIRTLLEWAKVSPDFRKATKLNEQEVAHLADTMDRYQSQSQKGNFHTRDLRDAIKDSSKQADEARPKFEGLVAILGKFTDVRYSIAGLISGLAFSKGVQQFASLEDAAFAVSQRVGEAAGTINSLIKSFRTLSRDSGYSAQSIANAAAVIAEKTGRFTKASENLTVMAVTFSRLTGASEQLAGELAGDLVKGFNLSEQAAGEFLQMANLARKGSRGMMGPEFIQFMTQNVELMRKLAQTTGFGTRVDDFLKKNASSMMALQKEFSMIYGDAQSIQQAMQGAVAVVGEDATKIRYLLAGSGKSYEEYVAKIRGGKLDEAFLDMAEAWQTRINKIPEENRAVYRRMFSQTSGIAEDQLNQLERVNAARIKSTRADLDDVRKRTEIWNKGAANFKATFAGILERLSAIWSYFQTVMAPYMKGILWIIDAALKGMTALSRHVKGFDLLAGGLITALETLFTIGFLRGSFKAVKSLGSITMEFLHLNRTAAATEGIFARVWAAAQRLGGRVIGRAPTAARVVSEAATGASHLAPDAAATTATRLQALRSSLVAAEKAAEFESLGFFGRLGARASGLFTRIFGEVVLARLGSVFASAVARVPLLGILGKVLGRFVPIAGWALLAVDISKLVLWIDKGLAKMGMFGSVIRLLNAPLIQAAHLVMGLWEGIKLLGHVIWDVISTPFKAFSRAFAETFGGPQTQEGRKWMEFFGSMLSWMASKAQKLADILIAMTPFGQLTAWVKTLRVAWDKTMETVKLGWDLLMMYIKNDPAMAWILAIINRIEAMYNKIAGFRDKATGWFRRNTPQHEQSPVPAPGAPPRTATPPSAMTEPQMGSPEWQQKFEDKARQNFLEQKAGQQGAVQPANFIEQKAGQQGAVQPAAFVQPQLPLPRVQTVAYKESGEVAAALKQVASATSNDDAVTELRRIGALIEIALRRMGDNRQPMTPRFGVLAEGSV